MSPRWTQVLALLCICFCVDAADELTDGKVCVTAQNKFTEKNTEFERCTMQHILTENFCMECISLYVEQYRAYDALMNTRDPSPSNQNKLCGTEVIERDHFDLLRTHFARSKDIWNRARCTKCFNCDPETIPMNGNITELCTKKSGALELLDSVTIAQTCFENAKKDICVECANRYDIVMAKYHVEKSATGNDMCFDVKDAVDRIQQLWHTDKCDPATPSGWSFTSILLLLLVAGAISYGSFRSYKVYRFRREYLTTAMANSDNSSNYGLLEERNNDSEL